MKDADARQAAVRCIALLAIQQLFMAERNGSQSVAERGSE